MKQYFIKRKKLRERPSHLQTPARMIHVFLLSEIHKHISSLQFARAGRRLSLNHRGLRSSRRRRRAGPLTWNISVKRRWRSSSAARTYPALSLNPDGISHWPLTRFWVHGSWRQSTADWLPFCPPPPRAQLVMIKAILIFNNHGKPRLSKFYEHYVSNVFILCICCIVRRGCAGRKWMKKRQCCVCPKARRM